MSKDYLLQISKLSKSFDQTKALVGINFHLKPGTITALIGPNGSGKTTLIKSIVGLHFPDKGQITVAGHDIATDPIDAKKIIGYVPDGPNGFDYLSGAELLSLTAKLRQAQYPDKDLTQLIKDFRLTPIIHHRISSYSRGNRQKLAFVAALIGQPKLLIIDEPVVGLDPESIEVFGDALKEFAKNGGAVLFSTHILEFGKRFANRLLVMHQGRIKLDTKVTVKTSLTKQYQRLTK